MTNKNPPKSCQEKREEPFQKKGKVKQEEKDIIDLKNTLYARWNEFYNDGNALGADYYPNWEGFLDQLQRSLSFREIGTKKRRPLQRENISILVPGCGTAKLSPVLYGLGYINIKNVDISNAAIDHMKNHHHDPKGCMLWEHMCMHNMKKCSNESCHAIIDKAAFDFVRSEDGMALTSDESALKYVGYYFSEVHRLLKNGGKFIYFVELLVRDWSRLEVLFKHFRTGWNVDIHGLPEDTITSSKLKMAMIIFEKTTNTIVSPIRWHIKEIFCWRLSGHTHKFFELVELENEDHRLHPTIYSVVGLTKEASVNLKKLSLGRRLHLNLGECLTSEYNAVLFDGRHESHSLGYLILYIPQTRVKESCFSSRDDQWLLVESLDAGRVLMIFEDVATPIHVKVDRYYSSLEVLVPQSFKDAQIEVRTVSEMCPPEKPHFETIGHFKCGTKKGAHCFHLLLRENTTDEQTSGDIDGDEYDRDEQTLEKKDTDGDRDDRDIDGDEYDRDEQTLEKKDIDGDRDDSDIDGDREDGDEQRVEEKAILEKKAIHEKIMRSCLEYFNEIGFTESRRTLEKESRIFNTSYFEHLIESGDWKETEDYLSTFVDTSCAILYYIQMQSSLEVAMVAALKAGKKLDIGDRESVKCEIIDEVKKLATAGFRILEKLNFPEDSRLWRLFSQSHCDPGLDHKHDLPVSAYEVGHHSRPLIGPTHVGGKDKMVIYNDKILGVGMTSRVREGTYDGRKVAVKCLLRTKGVDINTTDGVDVNPKEVQSLVEANADSHENVVTCYGMEVDTDHIYIALELCTCTLDELITGKNDAGIDAAELRKKYHYPSTKLLGIMRDIICGLGHLHNKLQYIHRDLKPSNILIKEEDGHLCAKISDMGMLKWLRVGSSSGTNSIKSTGGGHSGIRIDKSPEQISGFGGTNRISQAADMFSLGCILFFCITKGEHAFEDTTCEESILKDDKDLFVISDDFPEAYDIIERLLSPQAADTPCIEEVKKHPFLWESSTRIQFLKAASDMFESEKKKADLDGSTSQLLLKLESISNTVFGNRWDKKLDSSFVQYVDSDVYGYYDVHGRYREHRCYDYEKVYDLLRLIRNKSRHWRELPEDVKNLIPQPVTLGIEEYFSVRFPKLLFEVYKIIRDFCPDDVGLQQYISGNTFY